MTFATLLTLIFVVPLDSCSSARCVSTQGLLKSIPNEVQFQRIVESFLNIFE